MIEASNHSNKAVRGFSLIEVMVAVGIIAILALLAVPNFTDRIVRDQIVEAAKLADVVKGPVVAHWLTSAVPPSTVRKMPADNAAAGLPNADKIVNTYISSVTVENGAVHLQFGNSAHGAIKGKILTLRPAVVEDAPVVPASWICSAAKVPDKMTLKGNDKTNIDKRFLPRNCF
ncbi:MAG: pilin [Burkholderiaceae bacterium]